MGKENLLRMYPRYEFPLDYEGFSYLVIFGKHINGWFICLPRNNVSCEAADPLDIPYNQSKLIENGKLDEDFALLVANMIKELWYREKLGSRKEYEEIWKSEELELKIL